MSENIPAGYQVVITSWENDADHYKDQAFNGLTKEDASFIIDLAKLFRSVNNYAEPGFGGSQHHYEMGKKGRSYEEDLMDAWAAVVAKHDKISEGMRLSFVPEGREFDHYSELASELVSYPGEDYGGQYNRVYDRHEVFFYETEVRNATEEFK